MTDAALAAPQPNPALLSAWAGLPAWRALDTCWGDGVHFLTIWRAWKLDPNPPKLLHYVGLTEKPMTLGELSQTGLKHPEFQELIEELKDHWLGLLPGFHRIVLHEGRVLLTLCIGDLPKLLRDQQFEADYVFLDHGTSPSVETRWSRWTLKNLARCCHRGTLVGLSRNTDALLSELTLCGFQFNRSALWGTFNPSWPIKRTDRKSVV